VVPVNQKQMFLFFRFEPDFLQYFLFFW